MVSEHINEINLVKISSQAFKPFFRDDKASNVVLEYSVDRGETGNEEDKIDSFFIDVNIKITDSEYVEDSQYTAELHYFVGCDLTVKQFFKYEEDDSLVNALIPLIHGDVNYLLRRAGFPVLPYRFMIIRDSE